MRIISKGKKRFIIILLRILLYPTNDSIFFCFFNRNRLTAKYSPALLETPVRIRSERAKAARWVIARGAARVGGRGRNGGASYLLRGLRTYEKRDASYLLRGGGGGGLAYVYGGDDNILSSAAAIARIGTHAARSAETRQWRDGRDTGLTHAARTRDSAAPPARQIITSSAARCSPPSSRSRPYAVATRCWPSRRPSRRTGCAALRRRPSETTSKSFWLRCPPPRRRRTPTTGLVAAPRPPSRPSWPTTNSRKRYRISFFYKQLFNRFPTFALIRCSFVSFR